MTSAAGIMVGFSGDVDWCGGMAARSLGLFRAAEETYGVRRP